MSRRSRTSPAVPTPLPGAPLPGEAHGYCVVSRTERQGGLTRSSQESASARVAATVGATAKVATLPRARSDARKAYRRLARWILLTDVMGVLVAVGLASLALGDRGPAGGHHVLAVVVAPIFSVVVFWWFDLYAIYRLTPPEEFRRILFALCVAFALVVLAAFLSRQLVPRMWLDRSSSAGAEGEPRLLGPLRGIRRAREQEQADGRKSDGGKHEPLLHTDPSSARPRHSRRRQRNAVRRLA